MIAEGILTDEEKEMLKRYDEWNYRSIAVRLCNTEIGDLEKIRTEFFAKLGFCNFSCQSYQILTNLTEF